MNQTYLFWEDEAISVSDGKKKTHKADKPETNGMAEHVQGATPAFARFFGGWTNHFQLPSQKNHKIHTQTMSVALLWKKDTPNIHRHLA